MGTHALVVFTSDNKRYLVVYFQFDGYLDGVGKDLIKFIKSVIMVNGISTREEKGSYICNGFGCMCARYLSIVKTKPGDVYVLPSDTNEYSEDVAFIYRVRQEDINLTLSAEMVNDQTPGWRDLGVLCEKRV